MTAQQTHLFIKAIGEESVGDSIMRTGEGIFTTVRRTNYFGYGPSVVVACYNNRREIRPELIFSLSDWLILAREVARNGTEELRALFSELRKIDADVSEFDGSEVYSVFSSLCPALAPGLGLRGRLVQRDARPQMIASTLELWVRHFGRTSLRTSSRGGNALFWLLAQRPISYDIVQVETALESEDLYRRFVRLRDENKKRRHYQWQAISFSGETRIVRAIGKRRAPHAIGPIISSARASKLGLLGPIAASDSSQSKHLSDMLHSLGLGAQPYRMAA